MTSRSHAPLIRLARFKLEELQKQSSAIQTTRTHIIEQIDRLEASVPEEQATAKESRDGFMAYGSYARSIILRKDKLRSSLKEVDLEADALRERIEEAFTEVKRYEILEDRRLAHAKELVRRAEQAENDEIAGNLNR